MMKTMTRMMIMKKNLREEAATEGQEEDTMRMKIGEEMGTGILEANMTKKIMMTRIMMKRMKKMAEEEAGITGNQAVGLAGDLVQ
jgi:hypothetical protein